MTAAVRGAAKRRKIAVVGPLPPPYGGYPHAAAAFLKLPFGNSAELITFRTNHHKDSNETRIGVSELQSALHQVRTLPGFLKSERPDVVLVCVAPTRSFWRDLQLINIITKQGIPAILRLMAGDGPTIINSFPGPLRRAALSGLSRTQAILVETKEQIGLLERILPGVPSFWYPNYIDASDFPPPLTPEELNAPPSVVFMGNMTPFKGVETILQSVDLVCDKIPARYHFIGGAKEPGYLETFREQVSKIKHADRVTVHGRMERTDAFPTMRTCQVYAFPSYWPGEGQPTSVLEAMMLGLVPVATAWRGIPEIVTTEKNGLLVEKQNPQALAEATCRVLSDSKLRNALSAEAVKTVKAEFESTAALRRFNEVLRVIGK